MSVLVNAFIIFVLTLSGFVSGASLSLFDLDKHLNEYSEYVVVHDSLDSDITEQHSHTHKHGPDEKEHTHEHTHQLSVVYDLQLPAVQGQGLLELYSFKKIDSFFYQEPFSDKHISQIFRPPIA